MEITLVEHMDEVLTHALVTSDGEALFKNVDIPLEVSAEKDGEHRSMH
jgi:hypothetical protein